MPDDPVTVAIGVGLYLMLTGLLAHLYAAVAIYREWKRHA